MNGSKYSSPEEEDIALAAEGNEAAFERLYKAFSPNIFHLALRTLRDKELAEDVSQETWLLVYRYVGKLRKHEAFGSWLHRITLRTCYRLRRQSGLIHIPEAESPDSYSTKDPADIAIDRELSGHGWAAMASLPPRQQIALFLREAEDRTYRDIARILGTSESAVETLLFRARKALPEHLRSILQASPPERCAFAQRVMAVFIDGEGTTVEKLALNAHIDCCWPCRSQFRSMNRRGSVEPGIAYSPAAMPVHRKTRDSSVIEAGPVHQERKLIRLKYYGQASIFMAVAWADVVLAAVS